MPVNCIRRWPNIETELGDCPVFALTAIRVHRQFIPGKANNHENNCEYFYYKDFLNTKVLKQVIIAHVNKDWCTEMSTVPHIKHPSFPQIGHKLRQNKLNKMPVLISLVQFIFKT